MNRLLRLSAFLALVFAVPGIADNILIWDHDNGSSYYSSQRNTWESCEDALESVLEAMGHQVTIVNTLPDNFSTYDMLFVTLGFYCPS